MTTDPVEIIQRALARDWWEKGLSDYETAEEQERDWMIPVFGAQRIAIMRDLEAAGYRIAGPAPTEEMTDTTARILVTGSAGQYESTFEPLEANAVWKAMHAKLPLHGSE